MSSVGRDLPFIHPELRVFLNAYLRPRLCEKSVHNEPVGKLFNFPLHVAVKRDEKWDCTSKSGGVVSIFPTGDMTLDFSHSLDPLLTFRMLATFSHIDQIADIPRRPAATADSQCLPPRADRGFRLPIWQCCSLNAHRAEILEEYEARRKDPEVNEDHEQDDYLNADD